MARVSIEDCLHRMPNRFALVSVAAHRTRQLMEGKEPLVSTKNKFAVTALREIAEGLIGSTNDTASGVTAQRENAALEGAPRPRKPFDLED